MAKPQGLEILRLPKRKSHRAFLMVGTSIIRNRVVIRNTDTRLICNLAAEAIALCSPPESRLSREATLLFILTRKYQPFSPTSMRSSIANHRAVLKKRGYR